MARGIDRTELLELLAETVNNENPMLHLMSVNVCWSWISSFCELFWTLPKFFQYRDHDEGRSAWPVRGIFVVGRMQKTPEMKKRAPQGALIFYTNVTDDIDGKINSRSVHAIRASARHAEPWAKYRKTLDSFETDVQE